jgi:hypothetical protein
VLALIVMITELSIGQPIFSDSSWTGTDRAIAAERQHS